MNQKILNYYLEFSEYTDPGLYKDLLKKLPDKIEEIGLLARKQIIHINTLKNGNTGSNEDMRYGDMTKIPWYRQCEDDIFPTVAAMLAELYRRDKRGLVLDRATEDKVVATCRHISILIASILKSKGIPCRVRSGFSPYFNLFGGKSTDHWINQYWNEKENRWVTIDVDGSLEDYVKFDLYDLPENTFDFSADAWFKVRSGEIDEHHFENADGHKGLWIVAWELFYDFHCLMNNEIIYLHRPQYILERFDKLTKEELKEIDNLALLMQKPDESFDKLVGIWSTDKKFRIMKGASLQPLLK